MGSASQKKQKSLETTNQIQQKDQTNEKQIKILGENN